MDENERLAPAGEPQKPEQNRIWLWKTLKPFGCILCLVCLAVMLIVCFTGGTDPIKGYEPAESMEYYAADTEALIAELEANVLPRLPAIEALRAEDGKVVVTVDPERFATTRGAVLRYFDEDLLVFEKAE